MTLPKFFTFICGLFVGVLFIQGCSDYDPVPASQCTDVVQHAQKVLGDFAPDYAKMMTDCKQASDTERGCVMAATKKGQVAQCM
ncbi:MAG: hypothetical protein V3T17_07340 [Pseudomonadales bacterium]